MGISTSNKYRRPSAPGPLPPPPWAPVNHSPVHLRAPRSLREGRAGAQPPGRRRAGVRESKALQIFLPQKKKQKTKTQNKTPQKSEIAPMRLGKRRLRSGSPGFRLRGLRGRGASPDGLLPAHGALPLRFEPTFREFRSSFHVVLRSGARGRHPPPKYLPYPWGASALVCYCSCCYLDIFFFLNASFLLFPFRFFRIFFPSVFPAGSRAGPTLAQGVGLGGGCPPPLCQREEIAGEAIPGREIFISK